MESRLVVNLDRLSRTVNTAILAAVPVFFALGNFVSFYFHFLTVTFILINVLNVFYLYIQKNHTLLSNYGLLAQLRYLTESIGPELRQYLFSSDTEERPFTRIDRAEVYRKAKNVDSSASFGTVKDLSPGALLLRHSLFPIDSRDVERFHLTFGEERGLERSFTITSPLMISAMSYGALGANAVRALARGASRAQVAMNTGEGGFPLYHLKENAALIFQMGTAKFGVRSPDGGLDEDKLKELVREDAIKMIEIKLSQGAKPGKGGLLPKEKITAEIANLRGIPRDADVHSPPFHYECRSPDQTAAFIRRVQDISGLPVGIKLCLGKRSDFVSLVAAFQAQDRFPDYMVIDGAEGGTGAAPKSFMDDVGTPLFEALPWVNQHLNACGVRGRLKLLASGKLINPGNQIKALCLGADAVYSARGFLLALGCIQALQCNSNNCPAGITTHNPALQRGLDIEGKAQRIYHYVKNTEKELYELCAALGKSKLGDLDETDVESFLSKGSTVDELS